RAADTAAKLNGYTATFTKEEVIGGQRLKSQIAVKFRPEPFSVYMKFATPNAGREVIYVKGRNNGNMKVRDQTGVTSWLGTIDVDPNGERARSASRYPITRMGMERLARGVVEQWTEEMKFGEVEVKSYPNHTFAGRPVLVIETSHPQRRRQFKFAMTRLWIDKETMLPVRKQQFDFPRQPGGKPVPVEDYAYTNVRTDVRFAEIDFSTKNPAYKF
ncbi:MAG: DUF1571 domain-containing protein, partial [Planctomycetota bacterium]